MEYRQRVSANLGFDFGIGSKPKYKLFWSYTAGKKCSSVWSYDKSISIFWQKRTFTSWKMAITHDMRTKLDTYSIFFFHLFWFFQPWPQKMALQIILKYHQINAFLMGSINRTKTYALSFYRSKMFWAGPNFLCQAKNLFTYCGSHKHFVPDKKMICIQ